MTKNPNAKDTKKPNDATLTRKLSGQAKGMTSWRNQNEQGTKGHSSEPHKS